MAPLTVAAWDEKLGVWSTDGEMCYVLPHIRRIVIRIVHTYTFISHPVISLFSGINDIEWDELNRTVRFQTCRVGALALVINYLIKITNITPFFLNSYHALLLLPFGRLRI